MKRRAIKLLLFLLAGAIINVAVAWGCAMLLKGQFGAGANGDATELRDLLVEAGYPVPQSLIDHPCESAFLDHEMTRTFGRFELMYMQFTSGHSLETEFAKCGDIVHALWSGWPSYTFKFEDRDASMRRLHPAFLKGLEDLDRRTPVRPIFPGFAINTIFYAAVLWVLFAVPFKVRRWRRIKRGQCASCGYSLRGSTGETCSECGEER